MPLMSPGCWAEGKSCKIGEKSVKVKKSKCKHAYILVITWTDYQVHRGGKKRKTKKASTFKGWYSILESTQLIEKGKRINTKIKKMEYSLDQINSKSNSLLSKNKIKKS